MWRVDGEKVEVEDKAGPRMRIAGETRLVHRGPTSTMRITRKTQSLVRALLEGRRKKEGEREREREKEILSQPYRNNSRIPRGRRLRVLRSPGLVRERGDTSRRYTWACIFDPRRNRFANLSKIDLGNRIFTAKTWFHFTSIPIF